MPTPTQPGDTTDPPSGGPVEPGGPLTPHALRDVAEWLDTYDELAAVYFDLLEAMNLSTPEQLVSVRAGAAGKEVQSDLRRWADEIESQSGRGVS